MKTFVATFVTPYVRANKPDDWEVHSFDDQFTCCFYFMPQYNLDSEVRSVPKPENLIVYADVLRPFERRFKGGVQIA
jgi:3-phenylpropionate/cinnamic acid dioxygenase small subunit